MDVQYIIGRNPVLEVLKSTRKIEKIYIQKGNLKGSIKDILKTAERRNIKVERLNKNQLNEMVRGNHQGVIAVAEAFTYSTLDEILDRANKKKEAPFLIILDGIEDPHNLGAIVRTAECAKVHGVIIPKRRAASVNEVVYKTSAGAVEHIPIAQVTNISDTIEILKDRGLWIYGADIDGENYYFETDLKGAIALVIGSEGKGLSRLVKEKCDFLMKIPMFGKISSLNAANAASILIYEVVRQNHGK